MSKFRTKNKISVGGKLPTTSVVGVITNIAKDLSTYTGQYTFGKQFETFTTDEQRKCDDAFLDWKNKVEEFPTYRENQDVVVSFVDSKLERVKLVEDSSKFGIVISAGYLAGLVKRFASLNSASSTPNKACPASCLKCLDLVHFIRESGVDVYETTCSADHWVKIKECSRTGYYYRSNADSQAYTKKEISPWLSSRYEPTTWYTIVARNYQDYYGQTEMGYFTDNIEHYKGRPCPTLVVLSECAYMESQIW
jgi:hypothetical protein